MDITVSVNNLTKKFGDFTAAENLCFDVKRGEIFGFLGPNGAGKSTTIRMLCGILKPTSGEGHVLGHNIAHEQEKIRQSIGYMSQKFSLYDDLTVKENLEFYGRLYGIDEKKLTPLIHKAVKDADIQHEYTRIIRDLPAGLKQRLSLCAATLHNPDILFLDEPTSGVDPATRQNFWHLINEFAVAGKTIFVTTHYMDEAEHCSRIALISGGKIIALDSPRNLKTSLPYDTFIIRTDDFLNAYNRISSIKGIQETSLFGRDIHILIDKNAHTIGRLKKKIQNTIKMRFTIEKTDATLEDVFVLMTAHN